MKTAIYIEDGVVQIVLTPNTAFEKELCSKLEGFDLENIKVYRGEFYHCVGGWDRQRGGTSNSLILRLGDKKQTGT